MTMHAWLWGVGTVFSSVIFIVKLKISPLKFRPNRSWTEKVKIYFFITRMCAVPSSFGVDSNVHFSPLVKHFNHYDDGHLIRGEHGSYSSEHNIIKFCWTDKRERVTKALKPQAAIPAIPHLLEFSWLLFLLVKIISCRSHTLTRAQSLPFFKLSVLTLRTDIPIEFYSLIFYLQMLDSTSLSCGSPT